MLLAFVPAAAWESRAAAWVHAWAVRTVRGGSTPPASSSSSRRAELLGDGVLGGAHADEAALDEAMLDEAELIYKGEAALNEAALDGAALLSQQETVQQQETFGSHLPLPPLPSRRWQQLRWQLQLLRRTAAAAWSAGALWLMLAIVMANASFLKLLSHPPPRALSTALWIANMPQGAEFSAFASPPGILC